MRGKTGTRDCEKCGKAVSLFAVNRHEKTCTGIGVFYQRKTPKFLENPDGSFSCPECGNAFGKHGYSTHWRLAHVGNREFGEGGPGWNRGLSKETSEPLRKQAQISSDVLKAKYAAMTPLERNRRFGGPKRYSKINGGIRRGAGRGKSGWYEDIWCDSSWELAWVIYAIDHSVGFERNRVPYIYEFEGKTRKFYPDFLLSSGDLLEIKGYLDGINRAKIASVPKLIVYGKEEIKPFIDYAVQKFGKEFVSKAYSSKIAL